MSDRSLTHATFVIERSTFEGTGTRLTYTENGAFLDGFDKPELREQGTADLLDALGTYLSREPANV